MNVFDVYMHQSNQSIADQNLYPDPLSNSVAYKRIAEIKQNTDKTTSETISVLAKEKHVILAFHNYGACSILFSVKVTYNVCPGETLRSSLVTLPRTVAPANDSEPTRVEGECNKEAVQVYGSLDVLCESNGEWNTTGLEGRCICKEDMHNNEGICKGNDVLLMRLTLKGEIYYLLFSWMAFFVSSFLLLLSLGSVALFKKIHRNHAACSILLSFEMH